MIKIAKESFSGVLLYFTFYYYFMKHNSVSGYARTRNLTNRLAVLWAIILLAILRFLYGKMWWAASQIVDNQEQWVAQVKDVVKQAPTEVVEKKEEIVQEAPVEDEVNDDVPDRFKYLLANDYLEETQSKEFSEFDGEEIITRATSTPYLARYAFLSRLEQKGNVQECTFPDVAAKTDFIQKNIIAACGYGLLRGSNWNFIPDRRMTRDELLTVLVRTKAGYLAEDVEPRFKNYFEYGVENWLLDESDNMSEFSWNVTKQELSERLYKLSLVK